MIRIKTVHKAAFLFTPSTFDSMWKSYHREDGQSYTAANDVDDNRANDIDDQWYGETAYSPFH